MLVMPRKSYFMFDTTRAVKLYQWVSVTNIIRIAG